MDYQVTLTPHKPGGELSEMTIIVSADSGDEAVKLAEKPGYVIRGIHPAEARPVEAVIVKPTRRTSRAKAAL